MIGGLVGMLFPQMAGIDPLTQDRFHAWMFILFVASAVFFMWCMSSYNEYSPTPMAKKPPINNIVILGFLLFSLASCATSHNGVIGNPINSGQSHSCPN